MDCHPGEFSDVSYLGRVQRIRLNHTTDCADGTEFKKGHIAAKLQSKLAKLRKVRRKSWSRKGKCNLPPFAKGDRGGFINGLELHPRATPIF